MDVSSTGPDLACVFSANGLRNWGNRCTAEPTNATTSTTARATPATISRLYHFVMPIGFPVTGGVNQWFGGVGVVGTVLNRRQEDTVRRSIWFWLFVLVVVVLLLGLLFGGYRKGSKISGLGDVTVSAAVAPAGW